MNTHQEADNATVDELAAELWQELVDKDDRTSPEEYPDMALITYNEFIYYLSEHTRQSTAELEQRVRDLEEGLSDMYNSACTNATSTPSKASFLKCIRLLSKTTPAISGEEREALP